MKTRNGFVTNSSSSSFIVAMKKDLTKDEIRKKIEPTFLVDKGHVLYKVAKDLCEEVVSEIVSLSRNLITDKDTFYREFYIDPDDMSEYDEEKLELFEKYGGINTGGFDSVDQQTACETDFEYADDDIYFRNDGGY